MSPQKLFVDPEQENHISNVDLRMTVSHTAAESFTLTVLPQLKDLR